MRKYLLVLNVLFLFSCNLFVAGSYGRAEYYDFQISTQKLIDRINEFKRDNPQYATREYSDGPDQSGNFYDVYFYLKDQKALVYCILLTGKERSNNNAKIGFHYIESKDISFNGRINSDDLSKEKNKEIKEIFEKKILDKLGTWKHN